MKVFKAGCRRGRIEADISPMKLQVKSLQVKNCGPLDDVEIDFTTNDHVRPVTVIGGANGTGKTTILELIIELAELMTGNITIPVPSPDDGPRLEMPELRGAEGAKITLLIDQSEFAIGYGCLAPDGPNSVTKKRNVGKIEFTQNSKTIQKSIYKQQQENISIKTASQSTFNLPSFLYFPAHRRLLLTPRHQINREEVAYQWIYRYHTVASFEGSLDSYLVWLEYAYPADFATIKHFLNEMVLSDKMIDHINRPELATMIKLPNGQTHRLDQLSSGEQNILIIMLELRRRLIPSSVVLIDEIENSLHPAFQFLLGEALLKLQAQIPFQLIITTHAPAFVDIFGPETTLLLTEF